MRRKWMIIPLAIVAIPLFAFIGGESVKLLWNWLLPPLFGWRQITFWQALGLLALCRILVGGFGVRSGGGPKMHFRGRVADRVADRMADRVGERWDSMTPEERERFRQRLRDRCSLDTPPSEHPAP